MTAVKTTTPVNSPPSPVKTPQPVQNPTGPFITWNVSAIAGVARAISRLIFNILTCNDMRRVHLFNFKNNTKNGAVTVANSKGKELYQLVLVVAEVGNRALLEFLNSKLEIEGYGEKWSWRREDTSARAKTDIARLIKAVSKKRKGKEQIRYRPLVVADAVSSNVSRIAGLFGKRTVFFEQGDSAIYPSVL